MNEGLIILAYAEHELLGFGCALAPTAPLVADEWEFLKERGFEGTQENTWVMTELAVLKARRREGIGRMLVLERLTRLLQLGITRYCLQTALSGSKSEILYKSIGAIEIGIDELSESKHLVGFCEEAIEGLTKGRP